MHDEQDSAVASTGVTFLIGLLDGMSWRVIDLTVGDSFRFCGFT